MKVLIDGVKYRPETPLEAEVIHQLRCLYAALWTEAYYDPENKDTKAFAMDTVKYIQRLNEILKFKE
jgi:hypothetical protein